MQWLVNSRPFEYCIILTIVGNCVVMSMDTHLANGDKTILALQLVKLFCSQCRIVKFITYIIKDLVLPVPCYVHCTVQCDTWHSQLIF